MNTPNMDDSGNVWEITVNITYPIESNDFVGDVPGILPIDRALGRIRKDLEMHKELSSCVHYHITNIRRCFE